jgi:hypothetical protein
MRFRGRYPDAGHTPSAQRMLGPDPSERGGAALGTLRGPSSRSLFAASLLRSRSLRWRDPRTPTGSWVPFPPRPRARAPAAPRARARGDGAGAGSHPKVVRGVFHGLHTVSLVLGVALARATQQLLVLQAEEAELAAVRAAEARGAAARPARALGLLAQQLLHQVVERVVGAQVGGRRAVLTHRAGGRRLHLPTAAHAPAAEVVAAVQRHRVAERVVADRAEQLLLKGAGRPGRRGGGRLHDTTALSRSSFRSCHSHPSDRLRLRGLRRPAPSAPPRIAERQKL